MKEFKDKVAVITGAASGIGRGLAGRSAQEGMKVVLADVEEKALREAEKEIKAAGAKVLSVVTDVSKAEDIEALAQKTLDTFGAVHLLCNNAGVDTGTTIWESSLADWEWVIGVNLWGVIHGVRTFVPIMLEQNTDCHIVNTASLAGVSSAAGHGIYKVTKFGVVTLSETLHHELVKQGAKIKVSLLCPSLVKSKIYDAERNRPVGLRVPQVKKMSPDEEAFAQALIKGIEEQGMLPSQVADYVFNAVKEEKFYVFTHLDETKVGIQLRADDMLQQRIPTDFLTGSGFKLV